MSKNDSSSPASTQAKRGHWFRTYDDLVDDPKVQKLPAALFRHLINLWCIASANDGLLPNVAHLAFRLRLRENKMRSVVSQLIAKGLLDEMPDGGICPHNWGIRQFKSDVSTERVKRFRKRHGTVPATPPDTDTDTEVERKKEPSSSLRSEEEALTEPPWDDDLPEKQIPPPAPIALTAKGAVYGKAKAVVGPKGAAAIGRLIKIWGEDWKRLSDVLDLAAKAADPCQYLYGVIANENKKLAGEKHDAEEIAAWKPTSAAYPESDDRGFFIKSKGSGKRLYLPRDQVQDLMREERRKRGAF